MKFALSIVALNTVLASGSDVSLLRRVARRHLQEYVNLEEISLPGMGDFSEYKCLMSGAMSESECQFAGDDCVFCPIGDLAGFCVSGTQAALVNSFEVPHLQCGNAVSEDDSKFWNDLVGCEMMGGTSDSCVAGGCSWCSMHGGEDVAEHLEEDMFATMPSIGFCMSTDFQSEILQLLKTIPDGEEAIDVMKSFIGCNEQSDLDAPGLMDMSCAMMSLNANMCSSQKDAAGYSCAWTNVLGLVDLCLTSGQTSFVSWYFDALKAEGIDLEGLVNGDMSSIAELMGSEEDASLAYVDKLEDLPADETEAMWDELWDGEPEGLGDEEHTWDVFPEEEFEMEELPVRIKEIPVHDEIPLREDAINAIKSEVRDQMHDEDAN